MNENTQRQSRAQPRPPLARPPMPGRPPLPARPPIAQPWPARPVRPAPASPANRASAQPRPTILGVDHVKRAIGDDNFYTLIPEFLAVKRKMEAMHVDFNSGCSPCKKRRVATSLTSDFVSILTGLSDDGLARVKKYMGVPRLMVRARNAQTGKIELKEI